MAEDNEQCKGFDGNDCPYDGVLVKRKTGPRANLCLKCKRDKKNIARRSMYKRRKKLLEKLLRESNESKGLNGAESSGYKNKIEPSAKKPKPEPKPEPATASELQPSSTSSQHKQEPESSTTAETQPLYDEDIPSKGGISLPRNSDQLDPAKTVQKLLQEKIRRLQSQLLNEAARSPKGSAAAVACRHRHQNGRALQGIS